MTTYTLSIEDRVGMGVNCTERAVIVEGGFRREATYNPNAATKPFKYEGPFDTPFSIVHPMRQLALFLNPLNDPKIKYDSSVNETQQKLFNNIVAQELAKFPKREETPEKNCVIRGPCFGK